MDGDARGCICYLQGKKMACLQVWLEGEFLWESSCSFSFPMVFENSLSCVPRLPVIQLPPMLQRDEALQPAVAVLRNATWPRIAVLICPLWRERNPWIQKQVWRSFCESLVTWLVTTASTHHHDSTFIARLGWVQHDFSAYLLWSNFRHLIWPTVSGVWCSIV